LRHVLDSTSKRNFTNIGISVLFWALIYVPGLFSPPLLDDADSVHGFFTGTTLNWWFRKRNEAEKGNLALAGMMVIALCAVHLALGIFYPVLGSKALAEVAQREYQPGHVVVCEGEYVNASSVNFYTGIPLRILNGRENALWYGSYFPDAPMIFDDDDSFQKLWTSPQ
jgi:hypothetical protein